MEVPWYGVGRSRRWAADGSPSLIASNREYAYCLATMHRLPTFTDSKQKLWRPCREARALGL
jgi:hypothetical protein